jgi:hypothetical protein
MDSTIRGSLRPTAHSDHLTTQPTGTKNDGTSPAARPDTPPRPQAESSDQTRGTPLTKPTGGSRLSTPRVCGLGFNDLAPRFPTITLEWDHARNAIAPASMKSVSKVVW